MSLKEYRFDILTDGSGDYNVTQALGALGELYAVKLKIGTIDGGNTTTLSYTRAPDASDKALLTLTNPNANAIYYPREQAHGTTKTGLTLNGTQIAYDEPLVAGALKLVVSAGGAAATGVLLAYVEEGY